MGIRESFCLGGRIKKNRKWKKELGRGAKGFSVMMERIGNISGSKKSFFIFECFLKKGGDL